MVEDRSSCKELDQWIEQLMECKQLTENQVKSLCEKVNRFHQDSVLLQKKRHASRPSAGATQCLGRSPDLDPTVLLGLSVFLFLVLFPLFSFWLCTVD